MWKEKKKHAIRVLMGTGRRMLLYEDCPQGENRASLTSSWDQNWLKRLYKVKWQELSHNYFLDLSRSERDTT